MGVPGAAAQPCQGWQNLLHRTGSRGPAPQEQSLGPQNRISGTSLPGSSCWGHLCSAIDVPWAGDRGDVSHLCPCPLWVWWHFPTPACLAVCSGPPGDLLGGHAACHGAPQSLSAPPTPGPPGRKSWLLHQCYESAGLIPAPNPSSKGTDTNCCWRGQAVGSAQERMEGLGLPHQLLQLSQPHLPFHIHQHHVHED